MSFQSKVLPIRIYSRYVRFGINVAALVSDVSKRRTFSPINMTGSAQIVDFIAKLVPAYPNRPSLLPGAPFLKVSLQLFLEISGRRLSFSTHTPSERVQGAVDMETYPASCQYASRGGSPIRLPIKSRFGSYLSQHFGQSRPDIPDIADIPHHFAAYSTSLSRSRQAFGFTS